MDVSHLIHHHLQQQHGHVMLNHLGWGRLGLSSNWGLNSTFTHSFIYLVSVSSWLHVWKARHGEGPIFLSTRLSDDNDGVHTIQGQELNNTQMFYYFLYAIIDIKILRRLHCLISSLCLLTIAHLFHNAPALLCLKEWFLWWKDSIGIKQITP